MSELPVIHGRKLSRNEIKTIWSIDRSEVIEAVYYLEGGALVLKPEHYDMGGWPPGESEKYTSILEACYDRGGWFYALFDGEQVAGAAILESRFIGKNQDQLQLKFLHVSRRYRQQGFGRRLFDLAAEEARKRGAKSLYISATPSKNTIDFYLGLKCRLTSQPDPELLELEPEDIHLEFDLG